MAGMLNIEAIILPLGVVLFDVVPYFPVVALTADHMVIRRFFGWENGLNDWFAFTTHSNREILVRWSAGACPRPTMLTERF
jgi:hypothetical protein